MINQLLNIARKRRFNDGAFQSFLIFNQFLLIRRQFFAAFGQLLHNVLVKLGQILPLFFFERFNIRFGFRHFLSLYVALFLQIGQFFFLLQKSQPRQKLLIH